MGYSRAGIPQIVLQHCFDEGLLEEEIEEFRPKLEMAIGPDGVD